MTDQASGHGSLTNVVATYYTKKILMDFEPKTSYYSNAPIRESIPVASGNVVNFDRYRKIDALYGDNTNEFTAQQMYLSADAITATLHERDGYVQLSRFATITARGRALDRAAEKVKSAAAKTLDKLIRNDIGCILVDKATYSANAFNTLNLDGGTLNHSGITVRLWTRRADGFPMYHNKTRVAQSALLTTIASSGMTVRTLQHGVSILEGKDVEPLGDGNYKFICHPDVSFQMTTNAGFKGWISPTSQDGMKKKPSEQGIVAGASVETSTLAYKFPVTGDTLSTGSGNVYMSLLFGAEAYGVADVSGENGGAKGFQFFLKESGPQSTNDPTNQLKQAGFSVTSVGRVLNKSAGIWIITTEL